MIEGSVEKVLGVKDELSYISSSIDISQNPFLILDILIVALLIYWMYLFLKETRAIRIVYGIVILVILFFASKLLNLVAVNYLLKGLTTMFVVAIPVVFQPELRTLLERLGQTDFVSDFRKLKRSEVDDMIVQIMQAVKELSKNKTGGLIVITQKTSLKSYINKGTILNSQITSELLLTIFHKKTPLHDGAVIIRGNKIAAAGCTLPLSDDRYDLHIGTRHRAAMGISEQTDAIVIVISEETGQVSLASKGILQQDIESNNLKSQLTNLIQQGRIKKNK